MRGVVTEHGTRGGREPGAGPSWGGGYEYASPRDLRRADRRLVELLLLGAALLPVVVGFLTHGLRHMLGSVMGIFFRTRSRISRDSPIQLGFPKTRCIAFQS